MHPPVDLLLLLFLVLHRTDAFEVATGTPADQVLTDDGEPIVNSMYIHVHVARPCSPRPASQARFGFGAAFPPGMVMRGWELVDAEEKSYGRYWRG